MLNKTASVVLASFSPSTYREEPLGRRNYSRGFSVRQDPCKGRTAHTKCGLYLLGPSLAAALLIGLFKHLAWALSFRPRRAGHRCPAVPNGFQYPASRFLPDISRPEHVSRSVEAGNSFAKGCWIDCRSWGGHNRFRLLRRLATKFTQSRQWFAWPFGDLSSCGQFYVGNFSYRGQAWKKLFGVRLTVMTSG